MDHAVAIEGVEEFEDIVLEAMRRAPNASMEKLEQLIVVVRGDPSDPRVQAIHALLDATKAVATKELTE